jgi:hypothetical protein
VHGGLETRAFDVVWEIGCEDTFEGEEEVLVEDAHVEGGAVGRGESIEAIACKKEKKRREGVSVRIGITDRKGFYAPGYPTLEYFIIILKISILPV